MAYKKDQGRIARMAAFWSLAILLFYGCHSLHAELGARVDALGKQLVEGLRIPVIGLDVTPALLIAVVVFAGGMIVLYRWLESPKYADTLIETESELRKVTWPTLPDAVNSSVVVMVTVVLLMAFLAGSDYLLGKWAAWLLTGRS